MKLDRRSFLGSGAATTALAATPATAASPDWASLASEYRVPEWFRDAKFGMWAHWGPQCQPEAGDWYGRLMYVQGQPAYAHHLKHYGHPSRTGFIDIIGRWKAEHWDPAYLLDRYRKAGARYFMAMACHHDNLDLFDSQHHRWNSLRVGPRRDIVGTWEKLVRQTDLKFALSNHSSHAWHWWQTAYDYDAEGPMRGRRYDAYWIRAKHGRGTWWDGLDPQELYTGPTYVPPDGLTSMTAMNAWHDNRDGQWLEDVPPERQAFADKWLLRQMDLVERYRPDMVYFDDSQIPFARRGQQAVEHFNSASAQWHGEMGVITAKRLKPVQKHAIVEDVERGFVADIQPQPWQTDTCIGNWHYDRALYERDGYKSGREVIQRMVDVVSKNGNLMLNVPVRGDGTIDDKEERVIDEITEWMRVNGEALYGSRPWRVFGEGPTKPPTGVMAEAAAKPFVAEDVRFTANGRVLHAFFMLPPVGEARISALAGSPVEQVTFQDGRPLAFRRESDALVVKMPRTNSLVPRISLHGRGLA